MANYFQAFFFDLDKLVTALDALIGALRATMPVA
jgi:hypothetical protein